MRNWLVIAALVVFGFGAYRSGSVALNAELAANGWLGVGYFVLVAFLALSCLAMFRTHARWQWSSLLIAVLGFVVFGIAFILPDALPRLVWLICAPLIVFAVYISENVERFRQWRMDKIRRDVVKLEGEIVPLQNQFGLLENLRTAKAQLAKLKSTPPSNLYFQGQVGDVAGLNLDMKELYSGTLVLGGVGSGKTSSSGMLISRSLVSQKAGGLILTYKTDEAEDWKNRLEAEGIDPRKIIVFNHASGLQCDFLRYEMKRKTAGAGNITNLLNILRIVGKISKSEGSKPEGGGGESFWEHSGEQLVREIITLIRIAFDDIRLDFIASLVEEMGWGPLSKLSDDQIKRSMLVKTREAIQEWHDAERLSPKVNGAGRMLTTSESRDFRQVWNSLAVAFPSSNERTRSGIISHAKLMYTPLMTGEMRDMFASGKVDITPEDTMDGYIIILDMSVQGEGEFGRIAQGVWKYLFQKAIERRDANDLRPVFLWVDEAQHFLNEWDQNFLTTVRSKHCATIFLTQNIDNFYAEIGEKRTEALLSLFKTQVFHRNDSRATNKYASDLIGQYWHKQLNSSFGTSTSHSETQGTNTAVSDGFGKTRGATRSEGSSSSDGRSFGAGNLTFNSSDGSSHNIGVSTGVSRNRSTSVGTNESTSVTEGESQSDGYTVLREYVFQPDDFKGLNDNYGQIEGVVYSGGRQFDGEERFIKALFYDPIQAAKDVGDDIAALSKDEARALTRLEKLKAGLVAKQRKLDKLEKN